MAELAAAEARTAASASVPFIDMNHDLHAEGTLFIDEVRLNDDGNRAVAEALARRLRPMLVRAGCLSCHPRPRTIPTS